MKMFLHLKEAVLVNYAKLLTQKILSRIISSKRCTSCSKLMNASIFPLA